ncbi:MAG: hypothetical protein Q4G33_14755 [bacterium]|nr:hypothetical protein [bacterium]
MTKNKNLKRAELTYKVQKIMCDNCYESLLFFFKDSEYEIPIGLIDILKCAEFAEELNVISPFPKEWWVDVINRFQI